MSAEEKRVKIIRMVESGMKYKDISELTSESINSIKSIVKRRKMTYGHFCLNCGTQLTQNSRARTRIYCSKRCADKYRQKIRRLEKTDARTCPVCGKIFYVEKWQKQLCCSRTCAGKHRYGK